MGVVRTTFGMIVAQIIRRAQIIDQGIPDPFPIFGWQYPSPRPRAASFTGTTAMNANENGNGNAEQWRGLEEAEETRAQNKALLRLVYVLERGLDSKMSPRSAVEWALARGNLIDNLKNAILGNYQWITGLVSVLESGTYSKKLLDVVIDRCDALINIREDILMNRVRHTSSSDTVYLSKALVGLERYFFLLSFTSYVNESPDSRFEVPFSRWVKQRTEIWTMLENLRRKGPQLYLFRPVDDLSKLSGGKEKGGAGIGAGDGWGSMFGTGREIAGELERFVVKNRTGTVLGADTILKIDHWRNEEAVTPSASEPDMKQLQQTSPFFIEGATNFRRIRRTHVYGVAQPTFAGAERVIAAMRRDWSRNRNVVWINLREEPIIYINGQPYVLRDNQHTLRNIRAYSGITASRLELLEQRLKDDVLKELEQYDGRMLLHAEVGNGTVPVWEDVRPEDVLTVREVMDKVKEEVARGRISTQVEAEIESGESEEVGPVELNYYRIPVTAEGAPVYKDFDDLRHLMGQVDWSTTGLVVNCQVGLGRSTTGTVIATLITHWLQGLRTPKTPWADGQNQFQLPPPNQGMEVNYQIINSLLRVIKNGLECKRLVDEIVDDCAVYLNLRDCIEDFRLHAENAADETIKRRAVKRGLAALERYFLLICFQSYLDQMDADTAGDLESFQAWMARHQEFDTILQELERDGMESLVPVEKLNPGDGIALTSEVLSVVNQRKGQVLALQTILKHDAFPGCQKMSLREKVEGAPNYRRVPLALVKSAVSMNGGVTLSEIANPMTEDLDEILEPPFVCGCAMPTKDAVVSVLKKMNAGPGGKRKVFWTCLREEPVVYVNKRPFVLRLFMDPLKNLETTGIARHRVENMERKLKEDILAEIRQYEGRVLLHDEELLDKGGYSIVPIWETVNPEDIVTPCDVFDSIKAEGYQVDFFRIPITDEQAPIPIVFDQIISRLKGVDGTIDVLFNCQMGRGRTTTGMVIACLMGMILNNDAALDMAGSYIVDDSSVPFSVEEETTSFSDDTEAEKYNSRNRYLNGEYKIILQLVGVLTFGKLAKRRTDQAIDLCEHMQNLRKAIYDYKLRVEGTETTGTRMWLGLREVGLNYLIRYFYLIVFADYLLEEMSGGMDGGETDDDFSDDEAMKPFRATKRVAGQRKVLSFSEWLAERREITNIIRVANQDFS
ncbi:hypothetical protein BC938DRAFT_483485 [Jimgerdemannia flammicorona]|uniref:Inositol hexakisphosphate-domain-containing protein n=1 Tax=Jimgerdemannia flammicorona TaxID=994334 RepID=A0A433QBV5_9FUNG|nr:hypothetical protein BC938DRAFT_483485 [Jimgerdemannia flammicorona]